MQVCLVRLSGEVLASFHTSRLGLGLHLADYAAHLLGLSIYVEEEVWAQVATGVPSLGARVDLL